MTLLRIRSLRHCRFETGALHRRNPMLFLVFYSSSSFDDVEELPQGRARVLWRLFGSFAFFVKRVRKRKALANSNGIFMIASIDSSKLTTLCSILFHPLSDRYLDVCLLFDELDVIGHG